MRSTLMVLLFVTGSLIPAAAQSAFDGPLAAPDSPKPTPHAHAAKAKAKKPHRAAASAATGPIDAARAESAAAPIPPSSVQKGGPDDPISLGMKWQGNNDSAAQTRYQNLDGNAFGSGAEVGMKLHF